MDKIGKLLQRCLETDQADRSEKNSLTILTQN